MQIFVTQEQKSLLTEIAIAVTAVAAITASTLVYLPIVAAMLGLISVALAYQYYDTQLLFAIDENGIYDARLGIGKIMWRDVSQVQIEICYRTRFLCLRVKNPEKFLNRVRPSVRNKLIQNSRLGFTQFNIDISGVNMNAVLLKQFIEQKIA